MSSVNREQAVSHHALLIPGFKAAPALHVHPQKHGPDSEDGPFGTSLEMGRITEDEDANEK